MSISNISSMSSWIAQLNQVNGTRQYGDSSGSDGLDMPPPPSGPPPGGGLMNAISQALSQIGVGSSSSTSATDSSTSSDDDSSSTSSSQDPGQAMAAFMQNLMAALHAQNSQSSSSTSDGSASGAHGYGHHNMQADLTSLIQQLSSSSSTDGSSGDSTDSSTLSSLQQSFQNLVTALGGSSNSNASLSGFLQALESEVPGGSSSVGNAISTNV